jgi:deoxyribodipyrimidine photo-lyase
LWTVDADVIVPSRLLEKEQYAAFHARRRLEAQLDRFLVPEENPAAQVGWKRSSGVESLAATTDVTEEWKIDRSVAPVSTFRGGTKEALRLLDEFVSQKLKNYGKQRNHPELDSTSRMSPYLHFGHISPITIALAVKNADAPKADRESYLNELLVWRELAVNFVTYNPVYDSFESGEGWAHRSLAEHAKDPRPIVYTEQQLESAETRDPLWNAAHMQMVRGVWMHNYMRMYWGKKILEWSKTPAEAYRVAVKLNDKYELDGRDPNGYSGIAWAIVGKFDRPWFERPIFGKIRYMSLESTGRKFDSNRYIEQQKGDGTLFEQAG